MNTLIREQAEFLRSEITDWDIEQIKEVQSIDSTHRLGQRNCLE